MAEAILRRARARDAAALAELHTRTRRISMPYLPQVHTDEETRRWMADHVVPHLEVWVAEASGEIAGYLALENQMVDQLYVAPEHQHRGIGSLLLEKAKQVRPGQLELYCFARNAPARAFYEARGFVPILFTDGHRNEEREPDVLYRLTVRSPAN
jgi:ribosomal protein S18 acetylase RimI-like enzyme